MPQASREMVLVPLLARTADGQSSDIIVPEQYTSCILLVDVTARTGTSPTLNVYAQDAVTLPVAADTEQGFPSGATFYSDFASFTQITAVGKREFRWTAGGGTGATADFAPTDATLTAGTLKAGPIGRKWRIKWDLGGTSPNFTFSVLAVFIP